MVTCSRCGTEARDGARFCGVCGQPIAADRPAAAGKGTAAPIGKVAAGIPAGKQTGFAGAAPVPAPAPAGPSSNRTAAMVAGGVLLLAVVALVAVLLTRPDADEEVSTDGEVDAASSTDTGAGDGDDTGSDTSDDGDDGSSGSGGGQSDPAPTTQPAVVETLIPVSVSASNSRADVPQLNCGGSATYGPWNLFDDDPNTGWGASEFDGTGQSVTARFDGAIRLTQVGMTPGFTKVGPRLDQGCASVSAFPFNHFIAEVLWTFDDGTQVPQRFERRGTLQFQRVDTTTRSVTMTITRTELPPGADTDTVISTMEIRGSR